MTDRSFLGDSGFDANNQKITNLAAPTVDSDAATRAFSRNASNLNTGTAAATVGGTGITSYAVGDLLYASSTTALSKLAGVATGNALISGGANTAPAWGKVGLTTHISGTLAAANGGTGFASYAVGDILYASTTSALSTLAGVATGNVLISGGVSTAPSWGKVGLTTHISGTLALGNGGTGATTQAGAANAILPSQTSQSGKYLTTDGTNVSWGTVSGGGTTTNALTFNNAGSGAASGSTFNGSAAVTVSHNTIGALASSTTSTQSGYFGDIFLYDDSTPSHYLGITNSANLTAARTLSINVNDADRTISLSGNLTVSAAATISGTNTGDQTTVSGNAGTATTLQTARNINGVSFNGSADITVTAAAGTLTGTTLASGVTSSSLTTIGSVLHTGRWHKVYDYALNGTPTNGVQITTTIPFTSGIGMYTVICEGYRYGGSVPEAWQVSFYPYNGGSGTQLVNHGASSWGGAVPNLKLGVVGGFVCLFLEELVYYRRFTLRLVYGTQSETASHAEGWTASDNTATTASATNVVTPTFTNAFGTATATSLTVTNTITGSVSGNAGTATTLATARNINGVSFNGSADITVTRFTAAVSQAAANIDRIDIGVESNTPRIVFEQYGSSLSQRWLIDVEDNAGDGLFRWYTPSVVRMALSTGSTYGLRLFSLPLTFGTDNNADIGQSANNRPRTGYFGTSVVIGTDPGGSSALRVGGDVRIGSGSLGVGVEANATDGRVDASNDIVAYSTSDPRLKTNLEPIRGALSTVSRLRGWRYQWRQEPELKQHHGYDETPDLGVMADEVEAVLPEIVQLRANGFKAVRYERLIPVLIEAIKELQEEVQRLREQNA